MRCLAALRSGLFSALAFAAVAGSTAAYAGNTVIFDSLGDTPVIHPEGINLFSGGAEAASFQSGGFIGNIQALVLDLNCSGGFGDAACTSGTTGSYTNAQQVVYQTGATAGSNQLTLTNVAGITPGSWITGGGPNGIAEGANCVTAVNVATKTLTLCQPLTSTQAADLNNNTAGAGRAVLFQADGSFTVSLYAGITTGIPGSAATLSSIPSGTALSSFPVFDADLYLESAGAIDNANPEPFTFTQPFGSQGLSRNTVYWVDLTNLSSGDTINTDVGWAFLTDSNQPGNVGVTDEYWYVKNYTCSGNPCSQINGGSGDTVSKGVFGMEVVEAPEPATLSILGTALFGLGLFHRRRRWLRA